MIEDTRRSRMTAAGLNLIAQALSIYDEDLRLQVSNAPFQRMFALPDALVTPGAHFEDTIRHLVAFGEYGPIDDPDRFVAERVEQARAFEPHYMERTRANGRTISVEGSPLPRGGWVAVYTDITQVKAQETLLRSRSEELSEELLSRAEELAAANRQLASTVTALEEAKRQLTRSEAQMRLTTEMMPAHIAHIDADGVYTYSNRRLSAILPGRPSEIVGLTLREVLGEETHARVAPQIDAAYRGEEPIFEFTDLPSARRIRGAFTPDGHGGVNILSMDVTEETQARAALQQTHRRNLAAQMTSGMAHDFSNLLTIVLGLQGRLKRLAGLPDEAQALIDGTLAATRRGGALLDRIGDMTAARPYRARATDLGALLADLVTLARSTLPDGLALTLTSDLPDTPLLLDPGMLQDALLNLILNARDACMALGGAAGRITLTARTVSGTWIELIVDDTGPGLSDTILDRALEPFFTTKGADGSGLGLPMVYDMAKLAGGDLQLGNSGTGARITLRLPLRPAPHISGGLVLLVEDDAGLRAADSRHAHRPRPRRDRGRCGGGGDRPDPRSARHRDDPVGRQSLRRDDRRRSGPPGQRHRPAHRPDDLVAARPCAARLRPRPRAGPAQALRPAGPCRDPRARGGRVTAPLISILDDEPEIRTLLADTLTEAGFRTQTHGRARDFEAALKTHRPDVCLVDLSLPDTDGLAIVHRLALEQGAIVIVISGRAQVQDRIAGLELGADDYITKPFDPAEVVARIRARLRSPKAAATGYRTAEFNGWTAQFDSYTLISESGDQATLSHAEAELLRLFLSSPKRLISRAQMLDSLGGTAGESFDRAMDVRISRLRTKLGEDPKNPRLIKTIYGAGYIFLGDVTWS